MAVYRFLGFELDSRTGELWRQQGRIRLRPQPTAVLAHLVRRHGEFVSRQELHRVVWPDGTFVRFEDGLNSCMKQVRAALGDSRVAPRFIETLTRRGYRFIAPVVSMAGPTELSADGRVRIRMLRVRDLDRPTPGPLAEGLSEELVAQLAMVLPSDLWVISEGLAGEPGTGSVTATDYTLATSVRTGGGQLRATAQLIESRTRLHIWAGRFDSPLDRALDAQATIAERVVAGVIGAIRDCQDEDTHAPIPAGFTSRA